MLNLRNVSVAQLLHAKVLLVVFYTLIQITDTVHGVKKPPGILQQHCCFSSFKGACLHMVGTLARLLQR